MNVILKMTVFAGTSIEMAIQDAQGVSDRLGGCWIDLKFNDHHLLLNSHSDIRKVIEQFERNEDQLMYGGMLPDAQRHDH